MQHTTTIGGILILPKVLLFQSLGYRFDTIICLPPDAVPKQLALRLVRTAFNGWYQRLS